MTMAAPTSSNRSHRHRGLSISFDPAEAEWVDALVALLKQGGYPKAARSEVIRIGLLELQKALAELSRSQIVKFFVQREADRLLRDVDGTAPSLPFK